MPSPRMAPTNRRVLVIGAGPSGLVAAKTLLVERKGLYEVVVVERNSSIGGTFRSKGYDDGRLVSSKYITAFSDFRFPRSAADHPTIDSYLEYLHSYCINFQLYDVIRFETNVISISRRENKYYCVIESRGKSSEQRFDAVCVCSGLHNVPYIPTEALPLLDRKIADEKTPVVMHSSCYKSKEVFRDKKVLIVGCGETGLDLVYRAVQVTEKRVCLSARSGFLSVPYGKDKVVVVLLILRIDLVIIEGCFSI